MQLPFALHKKIGSVCLHSKMWIDLSNRSTSAVRKEWSWDTGSAAYHKKTTLTVEKKSKWQKVKTKSFTFSAFAVHYRQSRLEISSRGTLQLFAVWKLPLIPVQNLRCRWNVSLQGSVGFWSSVLTSLQTFKTYNSFFPFEKLKEYYTPPPPGVVFFTVQNSVQRRILPFRWNGEFCACVFNNLHVATLRLRSRKPNLLTWAVNSNPYKGQCELLRYT